MKNRMLYLVVPAWQSPQLDLQSPALYEMGLFDCYCPLTKQCCRKKSQSEMSSWECRESNPGQLGFSPSCPGFDSCATSVLECHLPLNEKMFKARTAEGSRHRYSLFMHQIFLFVQGHKEPYNKIRFKK